MDSSIGRAVKGTFRNIFARGNEDETTRFTQFRNEPAYDTTEMSKIANGSVSETGYGSDKDYREGEEK